MCGAPEILQDIFYCSGTKVASEEGTTKISAGILAPSLGRGNRFRSGFSILIRNPQKAKSRLPGRTISEPERHVVIELVMPPRRTAPALEEAWTSSGAVVDGGD